MWLKNLTPVGLVSYLVTNYGYCKVLKLLDGNLEVAKQHLTTYFLGHDAEITLEQASYLANCAMKVLQTAGQIAVHQVAANRFSAVRKVAKLKTRPGRIGNKGVTKRSGGQGGVAGAKVERIDKIIKGSSRNVQEAYSSVKAWLGEDCRMITKDAGDIILMSKDGLRKLRFDIKNSHGYPSHVHLEILKNGKWKNALSGVHHLYPKGINHKN